MKTASTIPLVMAAALLWTGPAAQAGEAGREVRADAERGRRLMATHQCGACHAIPGVAGARSANGPSLEMYGRRSYIAGHIPNRPEALAKWIVDPRSLIPGTSMPGMGVSQADARDMATYLGTLR